MTSNFESKLRKKGEKCKLLEWRERELTLLVTMHERKKNALTVIRASDGEVSRNWPVRVV